MNLTINLAPITKKNSQILVVMKGRPRILPSKQYLKYEKAAGECLKWDEEPINVPVEITYKYYMPTRRRVDLTNLIEATDDLLVKHGVLLDDNCKIIVSHDGSRVFYDKENPRTEITIRKLKSTEYESCLVE